MKPLSLVSHVLNLEAQALTEAATRLDEESIKNMLEVFDFLKLSDGRLIFCGVGKSGIIALKLAATFTSLGLASHSLHPVEALHGDLGLVGKNDAIVFISKSGNTEEILRLFPFIPIDPSMWIALVGNVHSPIAHKCKIVFDCSVKKEACINDLAPTTSSTLALAMGDALAVLYESQVGLSKENFAVNHPGGLLGKSLRMKVLDIMKNASEAARVSVNAKLKDVILAMTKNPLGACAVIEEKTDKLLGILVEGDIRRTFTKTNQGLETPVENIMNPHPITITPNELAYNALILMEKDRNKPISILPVIDENKKFLGILRIHDIWKEGLSLKD